MVGAFRRTPRCSIPSRRTEDEERHEGERYSTVEVGGTDDAAQASDATCMKVREYQQENRHGARIYFERRGSRSSVRLTFAGQEVHRFSTRQATTDGGRPAWERVVHTMRDSTDMLWRMSSRSVVGVKNANNGFAGSTDRQDIATVIGLVRARMDRAAKSQQRIRSIGSRGSMFMQIVTGGRKEVRAEPYVAQVQNGQDGTDLQGVDQGLEKDTSNSLRQVHGSDGRFRQVGVQQV